MLSSTLRLIAALLALMPAIASAAPAKLKLSFFSSDRSIAYQVAVKPFVEAVNREGKGLVEIEVYFSGALGRVQRELPAQVLGGVADIAFIVPGQNPDRFTDNAVIELPGLYRDAREATLAHTRLVAAGALSGYQDFFVIGAYGTSPEIVTSRKPINALADLKGQKIRVNNATEGKALAGLGAAPTLLAFNETSPAIAAGTIDGAAVAAAQLFDVGFGSLTTNHYLLGTSAAPLALVMNRKVFEALPAEAQRADRQAQRRVDGAAIHRVVRRIRKDREGADQDRPAAQRRRAVDRRSRTGAQGLRRRRRCLDRRRCAPRGAAQGDRGDAGQDARGQGGGRSALAPARPAALVSCRHASALPMLAAPARLNSAHSDAPSAFASGAFGGSGNRRM